MPSGGRVRGAFSYKKDHEDIIFGLVTTNPQSTNKIVAQARQSYFPHISHATITRLLESMKTTGRIKGASIGRSKTWRL